MIGIYLTLAFAFFLAVIHDRVLIWESQTVQGLEGDAKYAFWQEVGRIQALLFGVGIIIATIATACLGTSALITIPLITLGHILFFVIIRRQPLDNAD